MEKPILEFNLVKEMLQDDQRKNTLGKTLIKSFRNLSKVQFIKDISKSMQRENQGESVCIKK